MRKADDRTIPSVVLPDTPAGRTARSLLAFLRMSAEQISFEEWDALYHPDLLARWMRPDDEARRERWRREEEARGSPVPTETDSTSPHDLAVVVDYADGRRWRITLAVEPEPPHRVTDERWEQVFDFNVVVREATEADAAALTELDRLAPIVQGDARITFDRGDDYFANARLLEHVIVAVAEADGVVAAVNWGAVHRPRIEGVERTLATALHLRVHPEHQGKGLWGAANTKLWEFFNSLGTETSYAFVHRDNAAIQANFSKNATRWSVPVFRALLPCADLAGPLLGRPATPSDTARIAEILNATHEGEEMFVPYDVQTLAARLERAPDLYSWERMWLSDDAVVGVWPAGIGVTREEHGRRSTSTRSFVLDYGVMPGAEAAFEGLLRAWCGRLADWDITELALFTWEGARTYALIRDLAAALETFDLFLFGIPEPEGSAVHGLYVDQIYI
jgi:L-amino acid N-acyltransferase YncA